MYKAGALAATAIVPAVSQAQWHTICTAGHCTTHKNFTIGGKSTCENINGNLNSAQDGLLSANADVAVVGGLDSYGAVVGRAAFDGGTDHLAASGADGEDEVGGDRVLHYAEAAPLREGSLHRFAGSAIGAEVG